MTTRKSGKFVLLLAAVLCSASSLWAAQRVKTYAEALEKAGDDGIMVYCYGADWNKRSVRMLQNFWMRPEVDAAAGDAVLLAAPHYQDPNHEKAGEAADICAGLPSPPFGVRPCVMLLDKEGNPYAYLVGMDYLGDENGSRGVENIRERLSRFRKYRSLLQQAEPLVGEEKAKLLSEAMDLKLYIPAGLTESREPYVQPELLSQLEMADPSDKTGLLRRQQHKALEFKYKLFGTVDGFIDPEFEPNYDEIRTECFKIINDKSYRIEDRLAAYLLFLGQTRREAAMNAPQFKGHVRKLVEIDPKAEYARAGGSLQELWADMKRARSPEQRKAASEKRREDAKKKKEKQKRERREAQDIEV